MTRDHSNGHHLGRSTDPDMFDVAASLRSVTEAIRHNKLLIAVTCILTLGLAVLYARIWPPIYRVEATVMAERDIDYSRDSFYQNWDIFRKDSAKTELELIAAGPVLKDVILREKLKYDDVYHPPLSQVSYLWEKSWVGRNYRAAKLRFFPDEDDKAITPEMKDLGRTLLDMRQGITIVTVGEAQIARVMVKGPSRRVAQITNTMLDVYLEHRRQRYFHEAETSHRILTIETDTAAKQLKEIEDRRLAYARKHGLLFDFQKEVQQIKDLTDLQAKISTVRATVAQADATLQVVENHLDKEPPTKTLSTSFDLNAVRETERLRRMELQTALIQGRNHYREDSPEIQEIRRDLAKLDAMIALEPEKVEKGRTEGLNLVRQELLTRRNTLRSELEGSRAGLMQLQREEAQLHGRLEQMTPVKTEMMGLDREWQVAQEKYTALALKRAQAAVTMVTSRTATPSVRVVEYAVPPGSKNWPKAKYLYPGALLVGLFLGMVAAQIKSIASGRVRRAHVEHGRGISPLYATVGMAPEEHPFVLMRPNGSNES
jgi:uncharacterized protein involved in exopolysaccharide biosynthesis